MISTVADATEKSGERYRWYVLALLTAISIFSLIDRQLPFAMAEAIKHDLDLTDGQLGLIGGFAFSVFYTVLCLPLARLADRTSRKWVITGAVAVWSAMTVLSGAARSMGQLFIARVGVALGEAGCVSPSHSMIADYFPPGRRATAMSLYSIGATAGVMLSFSLGGWLCDRIGWRATYLLFGAPGLAVALLAAWTLREPPRCNLQSAASPARSMIAGALQLLRIRTFHQLAIAASCHAISATAIMAWTSPFLIRSHDFSAAQAGLTVGLLSGVAGSVCIVLGGVVADRLARRDRRWQMWIPALGVALGVPLYLIGLLMPQLELAMAAMVLATLVSTSYAGPVFATAQELADPDNRATASALMVLIVSLVAGAGGPPVTGFISDTLQPTLGANALRVALCIVMMAGSVAAAFFFMRTATSIVRDTRRSQAASAIRQE